MSEKSEKGYKNDEILRLSVPVFGQSIFYIFLDRFHFSWLEKCHINDIISTLQVVKYNQ